MSAGSVGIDRDGAVTRPLADHVMDEHTDGGTDAIVEEQPVRDVVRRACLGAGRAMGHDRVDDHVGHVTELVRVGVVDRVLDGDQSDDLLEPGDGTECLTVVATRLLPCRGDEVVDGGLDRRDVLGRGGVGVLLVMHDGAGGAGTNGHADLLCVPLFTAGTPELAIVSFYIKISVCQNIVITV